MKFLALAVVAILTMGCLNVLNASVLSCDHHADSSQYVGFKSVEDQNDDYWIDSTLTNTELKELQWWIDGLCTLGMYMKEPDCDVKKLKKLLDQVYSTSAGKLAQRASLTGKIIVRVIFDKQGRVRFARIIVSDILFLNEQILRLVQEFTCSPAIGHNDKPLPCIIDLPFVFR